MRQAFLFVGNHPCLDFINTQLVQHGRPADLLGGFADLVAWLRLAGAVGRREAHEALARWDGRPEGQRAFQRAIEFRRIQRGMVERIVAGKPVADAALEEINRLLQSRSECLAVTRTRGGYAQRRLANTTEAVHLLVPVAKFASDLLCTADLSLVRKCRNPACTLYFYDTSKNHARRWCSMRLCGNRMKVAAHARRRAQLY